MRFDGLSVQQFEGFIVDLAPVKTLIKGGVFQTIYRVAPPTIAGFTQDRPAVCAADDAPGARDAENPVAACFDSQFTVLAYRAAVDDETGVVAFYRCCAA